jgi:hypothetical protein
VPGCRATVSAGRALDGEEADLLRATVLEDLEVVTREVIYGLPLPVCDHGPHLHQLRVEAYDLLLFVLRRGRLPRESVRVE